MIVNEQLGPGNYRRSFLLYYEMMLPLSLIAIWSRMNEWMNARDLIKGFELMWMKVVLSGEM